MYDGKGNYFGASYDSSAYKTYSIYTSTAAYNASLGGDHYGSVSSGITNPRYYNAYGPFSVTDDMAVDVKYVAGDSARKVDYYVTPSGVAFPSSRKAFDETLSKLNNNMGKYYGNDSGGPVRIRVEQHKPTPNYTGPHNPFHTAPHFHIDRRENITTGSWRKTYTG